VAELKREARPCAVVDTETTRFWAGGRDLSRQPLVPYLREELSLVFRSGSYDFRMR
jgi:hypothetical protein